MVKIDGVNVNITIELQELLRQNPPQKVKKAVIDRKKDDKGDSVQVMDEFNQPKFEMATVDTHPFVYFDAYGNYYLRAFRTTIVEHNGKKVEVIVTNPKIATNKDCNLYGKGVISHRQPIPGSELWDNGRTDLVPHSETVCKGDPLTLIVKTMTRDEVLEVDLKPQGTDIVAQVANLTDAQKTVLKQYLNNSEE